MRSPIQTVSVQLNSSSDYSVEQKLNRDLQKDSNAMRELVMHELSKRGVSTWSVNDALGRGKRHKGV